MGVGNWIADVFRAGTGADFAIHNRGGIRKRLVPGPLTRRDLFELLPFDNDLVTMTLTGAELEAMMACSNAALALYDMVKAVEKGAVITDLRLLAKSGGRSGTYRADES